MARRGYKVEKIIHMLREAEVLQSQGKSVSEICKKLGVSDQTYYRWRKECGGRQMAKDIRKQVTAAK